jgi:hypothetical protein
MPAKHPQRSQALLVPLMPWGEMTRRLRDLACGAIHPYEADDYASISPDFWDFLAEIGFLAEQHATDEAKAYLQGATVRNDRHGARLILRTALERSGSARLICSVLYGCSGVGRDNVLSLLRLHGWRGPSPDRYEDHRSTESEESVAQAGVVARTAVYHFLHLLNEAGLAAYSKKNDRLRVIWNPDGDAEAPGPAFISPATPYSNIRRTREIMRSLEGGIVWIDKHFSKRGLEIIADAAEAPRVTSVTVISTDEHWERSRDDYNRLRTELGQRGIALEWRLLPSTSAREIHDRWLLDARNCWNVPPVNSIFRNQVAEIKESSGRPDVERYVQESVPAELQPRCG